MSVDRLSRVEGNRPVIVDGEHVAPMTVRVDRRDFQTMTGPGFEDDDELAPVMTGIVAEQVARNSGYRVVEVRGVEIESEYEVLVHLSVRGSG